MLRAAAIQLNSTEDFDRNRARAERLVREAAGAGARLVVLPEKWNRLEEPAGMAAAAEPLDGPATAWARALAAELSIDLVAGSITERASGANHNTSVHAGPSGDVRAAYRKLHLFDVDVGGVSYRESAGARPGAEVVVGEALGRRIGLSVCYDLRFPELYRGLADRGAEILTVPSAFTAATGKDHWEPLLRARAIENQAFVIAAGQSGTHPNGNVSHGRSMVVDPWGVVLAQAPDGEAVAVADLDFARLREVRERLPALRHRRRDVFGEA
jgi:predicted amidohydrolase